MFSEKYAQLERGVHEQVEQDLMDLGGVKLDNYLPNSTPSETVD